MSICNEAKIYYQDNRIKRSGLPTEAAIKVLNEKIGNYV